MSGESPGITRRRKGASFAYHDKEGKRIRDPLELKRVRSLAIPPAWEKVWICAQANGHLQSTGIDAKGRKQYKYHPIWRTVRDEAKFERLLSFAQCGGFRPARSSDYSKVPRLAWTTFIPI
jgi:DNA topoisomerase-1